MTDNKKIPGYDRIAAKVALMQAYLDGKTIEFKDGNGAWRSAGSIHAAPTFGSDIEYRVRPTPDSIEWRHVAINWKFMARDSNGKAWLYEQLPFVRDYGFSANGDCIPANHFNSLSVGSQDWKDSLITRPEGV